MSKKMSDKARTYTFHLHRGDITHALCIDKLDGIRQKMEAGELKKGSLSAVIANALYSYFNRPVVEIAQGVSTTPDFSQTITHSEAAASKTRSHDARGDGEEYGSSVESPQDCDNSYNVTNSLLNLSRCLKKGGE